MIRRALFLVNHRSRSGRQVAGAASRILRDLGFALIDVPLVAKASLTDTLSRLAESRPSLAIVGGGDGTLNSTVDALAHLKLPVGILPLGTANDFARTLGIPQNVRDACRVIAGGRTKRIDLGLMNGKYFLNDASIGVSSSIAGRLTRTAKKRWGVFAAAGMALNAAAKARRFHVDILCDKRTFSVAAYQVTIGNGVFLGGVTANFDAAVDDKLLDMYVLETKRVADVARMLPYLATGRYNENPFVLTAKGKRFVVKTKRRLRVYSDGEPAGTTPVTIEVAPKALRVFVP
jgi:YegS/Rv2252/BmrU family lipid kinase